MAKTMFFERDRSASFTISSPLFYRFQEFFRAASGTIH
ncbi:hypothetical protein BSM4216_0331 [Bacillus smithii]|nr:hypothetical protein BSM4216_0331 [Bacillus smithii]